MNLPDEKREEFEQRVREAVIDWNTLGAPKSARDVSAYLADALAPLLAGWLAEARGEAVESWLAEAERQHHPQSAALYMAGWQDGVAVGEARVRARVEEFCADWERSADEDERYLNRAHASEIHDVYASIRMNREHATALRDALDADAAETTGGGA